MKKHIIIAAIAASISCCGLASCTLETYDGSSYKTANWFVDAESDNNSADTPAVGGEVQNEGAPQAEMPQEQEAHRPQSPKGDPHELTPSPDEQEADDDDDYSEYVYAAQSVIASLSELDLLAGGTGLYMDENDVVQEDIYSYTRVYDQRFSSASGVSDYIDSIICGDLLYSYSGLYSGDVPAFRDFDGGLYFLDIGRGNSMVFQGSPAVTSAAGGSFTFTVPIDYYGTPLTLVVDVVNDGGIWKACSFDYIR